MEGRESEEFISEPISPEKGTFSTGLMATGLASPPAAFFWRNQRYQIVECLSHVKRSSPEGGVPGKEQYLRRQEFVVRLDSGEVATLYFERQARRGASREAAKHRWYLYSIRGGERLSNDAK